MRKAVLDFPKAGESKLYGYAGSMVAFTIENQLLDAEKWTLFVEQFRLKPDGENYGWRGEYWGKMMRGASLTYRATKNEKLYAVLVETIKDMLSVQEVMQETCVIVTFIKLCFGASYSRVGGRLYRLCKR